MQKYGIADKGILNPSGLAKFCEKNNLPDDYVQKAQSACGQQNTNAKECQVAEDLRKCLGQTFCPGQERKATARLMRRLFPRKN